uniref:FBD-associated F-box protein At5g56700 n=1 Tax=Nicotiana sylvestris TaxID=4096 RepID=A0A1U7VSF7_NICSY|nr:PREDICTED: putative FBD-associated F-box protein At5g56700 [Nicotiana sylvestris]
MRDGQYCTSHVRLQQDPVECKIDALSDELLVAILSYLSVKKAATTCLVSRRWRYLWQYTSGCLEIYDRDKRTRDPNVEHEFVKLEVKVFELNLATGGGFVVGLRYYHFPDIEKFHLTLSISVLRRKSFIFFLSNCPCLEKVRVSGSKCLQNLKVTGPLPSLKFVELSWCYNVESLEVDASNLESFTYIGPYILVPFENLPKLSELSIGHQYCHSFIFDADKHTRYSSKLRKLRLIVPPQALWSRLTSSYPDNFPRLDNLKVLELDLMLKACESLLFFTFLVNASPLLSNFTARIQYTGVLAEECMDIHRHVERTAWRATRFVHNHLKVVKIIGFTGCRSDFNLALHLLGIGESLKEMILQPTNERHHYKVKEMAATLMEKQSKQLEQRLPPGAKLVML